MSPFLFVDKWYWAICIVLTFVNAGAYQVKARRQIEDHPELKQGYQTIAKGLVTWGNLPWVVMGVGCVFGGVPSGLSFFRPRDGNPFVLAFFASVFLLLGLGTCWLAFRGGAKLVVDHPGLFNVNLKSPRTVMILWSLCVVGGVLTMISMLFRP